MSALGCNEVLVHLAFVSALMERWQRSFRVDWKTHALRPEFSLLSNTMSWLFSSFKPHKLQPNLKMAAYVRFAVIVCGFYTWYYCLHPCFRSLFFDVG